MIPRTAGKIQPESWRQQWQQSFRHPAGLLQYLQIDISSLEAAPLADSPFPMRVPRAFADRMAPGNIHDPLLRQVLPLADEAFDVPGFLGDPVGDLAAETVPGLLHKYTGRALLITSSACAVNCRYCFRREYPYQQATASGPSLEAALAHLSADSSINEIILSGGDPLSLSDRRLSALISRLEQIPHLERLRLHTRLPVVIPDRVTDELVNLLEKTRLQTVMVVHINHPNELDPALQSALERIATTGSQLLNQTVLLAGINDSADTLVRLSEELFRARVIPYYLHQLDRVSGAAHFEVSDRKALELELAVRTRLPGYLVPRLVREVAGQHAKSPLLELMQDSQPQQVKGILPERA